MNYHQQQSQQHQQQHHLIFVSPYSKNETSNNSATVQNLPIVLSTTSSSTNCNSNNNSNQIDGNVKIKMIQQSTHVQHPRLHPKKRKFDLAELEEDAPASSSNACNNQEPPQAKSYESKSGVNVQNLNGNGTLDAPNVVHENHHATPIATSQYLKTSRETEHFTKKPYTSNYR